MQEIFGSTIFLVDGVKRIKRKKREMGHKRESVIGRMNKTFLLKS